MYQKIVMSTDGSDLSHAVLPEVERLAGPGSEVVVVEVVDSVGHIVAQTTPAGFGLEGVGRYNVDAAEQVVRAQHDAAQEHLDQVKTALGQRGITNVSTRILEGLPGPAIVDVAEDVGADVIVMATHGRSGVMRAVLGSVADHVVRHSPRCPVLLVRPPEPEE